MLNYTAYKAVPVTGATSVYSAAWTARAPFSLTLFATGTLTGNFVVQATDKPQPDLTSDADWVDVSDVDDFAALASLAGTATSFHLNTWDFRAGQVRLKYTNSSGTGTLTAFVSPDCA